MYNYPVTAYSLYLLAAALGAALVFFLVRLYSSSRGSDEWSPPQKGSRLALLNANARLRDFYRLAVMTEEEGLLVYLRLSEIAKSPETRKLCAMLAEKEAQHKLLFQGYLNSWDKLRPNQREWPVLLEELKKAGIFEYMPERETKEEELAWYAIRQEIKAAAFYRSFEESFPDSWRRLKMHELVQEELGHERLIRAAYPQLPQ